MLAHNGKQGLICHQMRGSLTIFLANRFPHTSTLNELRPDPGNLSLGVGFVQKTKNLTVSNTRRHLLEDIVSFDILRSYEISYVWQSDNASPLIALPLSHRIDV
jgi:hypothetical protein